MMCFMQWAAEVLSVAVLPVTSGSARLHVSSCDFVRQVLKLEKCLNFEDIIRKIPTTSCMPLFCFFPPLAHFFLTVSAFKKDVLFTSV